MTNKLNQLKTEVQNNQNKLIEQQNRYSFVVKKLDSFKFVLEEKFNLILAQVEERSDEEFNKFISKTEILLKNHKI